MLCFIKSNKISQIHAGCQIISLSITISNIVKYFVRWNVGRHWDILVYRYRCVVYICIYSTITFYMAFYYLCITMPCILYRIFLLLVCTCSSNVRAVLELGKLLVYSE